MHSFIRSKQASGKEDRSVCVHDGPFHCDEVTAVAMLRFLYNVHVSRSRDPEIWEQNQLLVDVGGVFDPALGRFDHHQRGFSETMLSLGKGPFITKLSSACLVYAHYGTQIIAAIAPYLGEQEMQKVFLRVYAKFIEPIDANDNGIARYAGNLPEPKFDNGYTKLSAMVSLFNADDVHSTEQRDQFFAAVDFVSTIFKKVVLDVVNNWLPAATIVTKAATEAIALQRPYILMDNFYPAQEFVEAVLGNESLLYVITKDSGKNQYVIKCLGVKDEKFANRKSLCESWRGLSGQELEDAISNTRLAQGVGHLSYPRGAVFVHAAGFVGAHATQEGAICMALMSAKE